MGVGNDLGIRSDERVREALSARGGVFGARMEVALVNDGPVTLLVEA